MTKASKKRNLRPLQNVGQVHQILRLLRQITSMHLSYWPTLANVSAKRRKCHARHAGEKCRMSCTQNDVLVSTTMVPRLLGQMDIAQKRARHACKTTPPEETRPRHPFCGSMRSRSHLTRDLQQKDQKAGYQMEHPDLTLRPLTLTVRPRQCGHDV